jgi:hypothetical protein
MYEIKPAAGPDPERRYVTVEATPDAGGGWKWVEDLHHDVEGALRSFRYLAQKARAGYDPKDERGRKVIESIDRHLATMERLKTDLVDRLFPVES